MEKLLGNHIAKETVLALVGLSILGAIFLSLLAHFYPVLNPDVQITQELQEDGGRGLLPFMQFVSFFGIPIVAVCTILITAAAFYFSSHRREALYVLFTPLANGIDVLLKLLINRPRPSAALVTVYQRFTDPSFPSGHVVYYVVFFGFLATTMLVIKTMPRLLRVCIFSLSLILILLVSVSRVYLGTHWATDTLGGYLVGFAILSGLLRFYLKDIERSVVTA